MCEWLEAIIEWFLPLDCGEIDTSTYWGWMMHEGCLNGRR